MADKTYVKIIEGHYVKDEESRDNIATILQNMQAQTNVINEQTAKLNDHTARITTLEGKSHISPVYDAGTESIEFI